MHIFVILNSGTCLAQASVDYTLVDEQGIWVEKFDSTLSNENKYTANNQVYKDSIRFIYRYHYISPDGKKYLQKVVPKANKDREKAWKLVPLQEKDSLTNDRLQLVVETDLKGADAQTQGYNHTPIRWEYYAPAGQISFLERSSLVENWKNIWITPPRARMFRIMALNPFPSIQSPYKIGNSWEWHQEVAGYWGDERWKEWAGPVMIHYHYTISQEEKISSAMGTLPTLVIQGVASSKLGSTSLKAHYHAKYGFVKLLFSNIDGSQILLELIELEVN
ncbi:hypothetical protein [Cesiribacter sp. SM1]|uniref:hypothetical protein n=1 Tax=Cesiribacter sp. SM1 TaxID=2861196 RepID=UPI001CD5D4A1|nr:hypothetical protein [Cesiribacter sp. SM1]